MDQLISYDQELFLFLNGLGNSTWDQFWLIVTNKLSSIPLYALLLIFIYKSYGFKGTIITVISVALLITCVDQLANIFKHGFMRPRPCRVEEFKEVIRYVAVRCGRYGYYSAHAGNSMAVAVFTGMVLRSTKKHLLFVLLFWAVLVGYSRIYVGVHYPGDVLSGWVVGAILGYTFYIIQQYFIRKYSY
ncbi:phosphatase PAP2 family protein [Dokdonia sp. Hel_I_53]|uniref:phosphatase PAP2 family protein n=1 Tax=Dokdonia sp. Hel_I_53 TaxID=1566287 RepID=UPI00119C2D93|nr:phosphatase PAP2 family protein [Dokdonia sp. Hel_I_53]TVZ51866.1 undecaprenyl-diphosphatase [Dokdonia sp. Hel_I_53]